MTARLTELGYPVLNKEVHRTIFGNTKSTPMSRLQQQKAEKLLNEFEIQTPVTYPANLYVGPLPLPQLRGTNLKEHFEQIAYDQVGQYKEWANEYSKCVLPPLPPVQEFVFAPGWNRYELVEGAWEVTQVPFPLEDAFTFDTETFVHKGSFPIIGTALSAKAAYVWLATELIDPETPEEDWDQYSLIPVGQQRFIAGHNISYDRVRTAEGYSLDNTEPENFFFDTLSAHIGVSGLAGGQRWLYVLAGKDPDDLTDEEKRKLRYAPKWLDEGSTNSLVQCYNFHVAAVRKYFGENVTELGNEDKAIRSIFVKATHLSQIRQMLTEALDYALKDAFYTAELFQALWPKYLESTPSNTALAGHYHLNGSVVPLVDDWNEWIEGVEKVFKEHNEEMTALCKSLLDKYYEEWIDSGRSNSYWKTDPWLRQLDWEVKSERGKYAGVPTWMRPFIKDPNANIGVKSRLAHLLLKLEWEGQPLAWVEDKGWCYWSDDQ